MIKYRSLMWPSFGWGSQLALRFAGCCDLLIYLCIESHFSQKLAACLSHHEGLWRTNSAFCKESQNPVYEHVDEDGSYVIYRSTYNITYETSDGVTGNQLNSIRKEEQLNKPTCSEPSSTSPKFKVQYADSGNHYYDYVETIISEKPFWQ